MKRVVIILFATGLVWSFGSAQGLTSLSGDFRYQYQYQDFTSAGVHAITSSNNPMLDLSALGSIIDPTFVTFNLHTALTLATSTSSSSQFTLSSKSFAWNFYDLSLSILQNFPVTTSLRFSDGITESYSSTAQQDMGGTMWRKQEQSLQMVSHQVPFLPNTSLSIYRTHQWSLSTDSPVDQLNTNYSINFSSGGRGGSVSVSGTMSESSERYSGLSSRFYTLLFYGVRNFADLQTLNYDINYNWYEDVANIRGTASYVNASDKEFHYSSTLSTLSNTSPTYQSNLVNLSQSIQYIQNDNFRYILGLNGNYGHDASLGSNGYDVDNTGGSANFSVQHTSGFKNITISNGLGFGYGMTQSIERQTSFSSSLSNSIQSIIDSYQVSAGQSISYNRLKDDINRSSVSNDLNLNFSGATLYNFQTQILLEYQSDVYFGDLQGYGNGGGTHLHWSLNTPMIYYIIPFTAGVEGGENWLFGGLVGRTYSWSANFRSIQFFVRNLTFMYSLNRVFDPNYDRESINHSVEMRYQFRAITMELTYQSYQLVNSQSSLWFSISRPF